MSLRFKIYKHNRTILLFVLIVFSAVLIVGQGFYFKSITSKLNNSNITASHSDFSVLKNIKQDQVNDDVKVEKPKPKTNRIPDRVIEIGNNIKFIGFIKSNKKVFILVEYGGIEYNLKQGEAIKAKGIQEKIVFDKISGDYGLFKIDNYEYRMSVKEKYTDIPLMAE